MSNDNAQPPASRAVVLPGEAPRSRALVVLPPALVAVGLGVLLFRGRQQPEALERTLWAGLLGVLLVWSLVEAWLSARREAALAGRLDERLGELQTRVVAELQEGRRAPALPPAPVTTLPPELAQLPAALDRLGTAQEALARRLEAPLVPPAPPALPAPPVLTLPPELAQLPAALERLGAAHEALVRRLDGLAQPAPPALALPPELALIPSALDRIGAAQESLARRLDALAHPPAPPVLTLPPELAEYKGITRYFDVTKEWLAKYDDGKPTPVGFLFE